MLTPSRHGRAERELPIRTQSISRARKISRRENELGLRDDAQGNPGTAGCQEEVHRAYGRYDQRFQATGWVDPEVECGLSVRLHLFPTEPTQSIIYFTEQNRQLTPGDPYLSAIQQPNVDLNFTEVVEITEKTIIGRNGVEKEVDTIICATGTRGLSPKMTICLLTRQATTLRSNRSFPSLEETTSALGTSGQRCLNHISA